MKPPANMALKHDYALGPVFLFGFCLLGCLSVSARLHVCQSSCLVSEHRSRLIPRHICFHWNQKVKLEALRCSTPRSAPHRMASPACDRASVTSSTAGKLDGCVLHRIPFHPILRYCCTATVVSCTVPRCDRRNCELVPARQGKGMVTLT